VIYAVDIADNMQIVSTLAENKCNLYIYMGMEKKKKVMDVSHIVDLRRGCLRFGAGSTNGWMGQWKTIFFVSLKMWRKKQSKGKEKVGEEKAKERLSMQIWKRKKVK
jgi:hypothetical protein